ncbi:MAG TPA: hypothetical protein VHF89_17460 [Solirubrobacteraceae bacterium]|nr:hypothetical protein [Solirubrobacteraceae bacterium]
MRAALIFGPLVIAGLVLAFLALGDRDRDPAFALSQQRLSALDAQAVEHAVGSAAEPRADDRGRPATSTRCTPGSVGTELRNPWRCVARYPSGEVIRYTVRIEPSGDFRAVSRDGVRRVVGRIALGG